MVGLDDLATLFQLQVREDAAARAVTATYKNQTIVLTPDQSLVSASGRLVSLPAPVTRRSNRWLVPVEFISRALAPIYDVRLDFRPAVAPGHRRRSARAARDGAVRRRPCVAARHVRDYAARQRHRHTGTGTAARAHRRRRARRLAAGAAAAAACSPASAQPSPTTIQMDLGSALRDVPRLAADFERRGCRVHRRAARRRRGHLVRRSSTAPGAPGAPNAPVAPHRTCRTDWRSSRLQPAHRVRRSKRS